MKIYLDKLDTVSIGKQVHKKKKNQIITYNLLIVQIFHTVVKTIYIFFNSLELAIFISS